MKILNKAFIVIVVSSISLFSQAKECNLEADKLISSLEKANKSIKKAHRLLSHWNGGANKNLKLRDLDDARFNILLAELVISNTKAGLIKSCVD